MYIQLNDFAGIYQNVESTLYIENRSVQLVVYIHGQCCMMFGYLENV